MKKKNRINLILGCLLASGLLFAACNENSVDSGDNDSEPVLGENFTFYKSESMAAEAESNQSEEIGDAFEIKNANIENDNGQKLMHIEVIQELGCEDGYTDKFDVIWDGIMLMIYPPQVGFYLSFDSSGCSELNEGVSDVVTLDLYELFGDSEFVDDVAKFTIVNASKTSSENDFVIEP